MRVRPGFAPLLPLAGIYGWALARKNAAFESGRRAPERLRWPVVSVGNLSVGGAGKTPVVIRLAELLREAGVAADVLSRGYGRRTGRVAKVDPAGTFFEFGDEPLLVAREAGVPVFVGASRYAAGVMAEREAGERIHLLDDGFQHRELARAVDIVLLHRSDFSGRLLPAGRMREPLSALRRADVIVLREEDGEFEAEGRRHARADALWWRVRRRLSVAPLKGAAVAFCAIARPEDFFGGLRAAGIEVAAEEAWRDHHRYTGADMRRLRRRAVETKAAAFLTTAKDAVKLDCAMREELSEAGPLVVAKLVVEFEREGEIVRELLGRIAGLEAEFGM
jgi:tetraacyldisaccharide 4'-kinase